MRRLPLTGLLLLPMAGYLLLSAERSISRRPAPEPSLKPRPRWTPSPSPSTEPLPTLSEPRPSFAASPAPAEPGPSAQAASPHAAPSVRPTGSIPDIDVESLLAALTRAGLECSMVSLDIGRLTWTCSADTPHASYLVVVNGARTDAITRLRATVSQADSDFLAARFLAGMAGLAYTGAEPAHAADWVKRNIAADEQIRIGPVRFALSGAPGARSLDVIAVPGQP